MRQAEVYLYKGKAFVSAMHRVTRGYSIADGLPQVVGDDDPAGLRAAVLSELSTCRSNVPWPSGRADIAKPLLERAGAKSWRAFARAAALVEVSQEGKILTLAPQRRADAIGSFEPVPEGAVTLSIDDAWETTLIDMLRAAAP